MSVYLTTFTISAESLDTRLLAATKTLFSACMGLEALVQKSCMLKFSVITVCKMINYIIFVEIIVSLILAVNMEKKRETANDFFWAFTTEIGTVLILIECLKYF